MDKIEHKPNPSDFFCPYDDCADYGKMGVRNIILHAPYGKQGTYLLRCKTCGRTFSENRGTPFFKLRTPKEKVLQALLCIAEGKGICATARIMNTNEDTISRWLDKAVNHVEMINQLLIKDLKLSEIQIDKIWSYIKKRKDKKEKNAADGPKE
jgi:DNA-binding protein